jgi:hypothetical protein
MTSLDNLAHVPQCPISSAQFPVTYTHVPQYHCPEPIEPVSLGACEPVECGIEVLRGNLSQLCPWLVAAARVPWEIDRRRRLAPAVHVPGVGLERRGTMCEMSQVEVAADINIFVNAVLVFMFCLLTCILVHDSQD